MTYLLDILVGNEFLYIPLPFSFPYMSLFFWLIVVVVTSFLSSYLPAQNAAQSNVRDLLAYE